MRFAPPSRGEGRQRPAWRTPHVPRRPPTTTTATGRLQAASPYAADASTNGRTRRRGPSASGQTPRSRLVSLIAADENARPRAAYRPPRHTRRTHQPMAGRDGEGRAHRGRPPAIGLTFPTGRPPAPVMTTALVPLTAADEKGRPRAALRLCGRARWRWPRRKPSARPRR